MSERNVMFNDKSLKECKGLKILLYFRKKNGNWNELKRVEKKISTCIFSTQHSMFMENVTQTLEYFSVIELISEINLVMQYYSYELHIAERKKTNWDIRKFTVWG
jgi:hypothetical protein